MIRGAPRFAMPHERLAICEALRAGSIFSDQPSLDDLHGNDIIVTDDYISDGPGFTGSIAFIVWGEPCFVSILLRASGETTWRIENETTDRVQS